MKHKSPPPIDGGWGWMVVCGVFLNLFFMMGIAKSCGIFMVEFIDKFKVSTAYGGFAITVASLLFALGSPIAGVVGENITHRKLVLFGGVVGMIGYSLSGLLISLPYVIVFYAIGFGIGNCCSYGSVMVMIGKYFHKKRSTATGIALSGTSVGQFAMPPIIEYLLETYGLGGTLVIIGAFYFHCTLGGSLFRPIEEYDLEDNDEDVLENQIALMADKEIVYDNKESIETEVCENHKSHEMDTLCVKSAVKENDLITRSMTNLGTPLTKRKLEQSKILGLTASCSSLYYTTPIVPSDKIKKQEETELASQKTSFVSYFKKVIDISILRSYLSIYFIFISFTGFFGLYNFMIFSPLIVVDRGMTKYDKAMMVSLCGIGDLIARLGIGYFSDRNIIQRYKLKSITSFLAGCNLFVFIFAEGFVWHGIHCFIYGFLAGSFVCLLPVVMMDFFPMEILSKSLGMVILAQGLGGAIGQPFLAFLVDMTGSYVIILAIMGVCLFMSGLLLIFTPWIARLEQRRLLKLEDDKHENGTMP